MWMIPTASALPDYVCLQSSKQSFRSLHIKASLAGACKAPSCCLCLPSLSWLIVPEFCWDHSLGPPVLCLRSGMAGLLAQATPVSFSDHLYHKSHFSRTKIQDKHPQANVKSLCGSHLRIKVAFLVRAVQRKFSSAQLCPTLCDPMNHSVPGLPVHQQLPESTQTHVHWVGDVIQPSHPLSSPFPPASIFPSIRVFSNESALYIRWPKY